MKRKRGGVIDKHPVTCKFSGIQTGADVDTTVSITTPAYYGSQGTTRTVIEVDSVDFEWFNLGELTANVNHATTYFAGLTTNKSGVNISDSATGNYLSADPNCFAWTKTFVAKDLTSGIWGPWISNSLRFDCTDGQGRGVIVATPNFYLTIHSINTGATLGIRGSMRYHLTEIALTDWIAIVEQQQTGN